MANKKSKNKPDKAAETRDAAKRTRMLQIAFASFSIILILSMILSLASK